jgi:hypothetical protein
MIDLHHIMAEDDSHMAGGKCHMTGDCCLPSVSNGSGGEWPPSVVVWSCQHDAVLYGFQSRHSPHLNRLLVPNKLMSHHEFPVSNSPQVEHTNN